MNKFYVLLTLILIMGSATAKKVYLETTNFNCIEIHQFTSDKENDNTRALKRAAKIPDEILTSIQTIIVDEIDLDNTNGLDATAANDSNTCPNDNNSLILKGVVTDYKKGNRAVRYLVSLGAGKQKIETQVTLSEKASSKVIAQGRVVDRKIGGLVGGSKDKGKRDFAEKLNNFIRTSIGMKKTAKR
ncbi:MAG: DUF4410 domain-containing protein [Proteobacteria bacterium]|nr:DUF4410 domain-containing protein [Pseudomonadota bacterium]